MLGIVTYKEIIDFYYSRLLGPDRMFFTADDVFYFTILGNPSSVFQNVYQKYKSSELMDMNAQQYMERYFSSKLRLKLHNILLILNLIN